MTTINTTDKLCLLGDHVVLVAKKPGTSGYCATHIVHSDYRREMRNFKQRHKRKGHAVLIVKCDDAFRGRIEHAEYYGRMTTKRRI